MRGYRAWMDLSRTNTACTLEDDVVNNLSRNRLLTSTIALRSMGGKEPPLRRRVCSRVTQHQAVRRSIRHFPLPAKNEVQPTLTGNRLVMNNSKQELEEIHMQLEAEHHDNENITVIEGPGASQKYGAHGHKRAPRPPLRGFGLKPRSQQSAINP